MASLTLVIEHLLCVGPTFLPQASALRPVPSVMLLVTQFITSKVLKALTSKSIARSEETGFLFKVCADLNTTPCFIWETWLRLRNMKDHGLKKRFL